MKHTATIQGLKANAPFIVLFVTVFLTQSHPAHAESSWPINGWERASLSDVGIDPGGMANAEEFVREKTPSIRSLLVIRNGRLVFEQYYNGAEATDAQRVASVTKSVTSILTGIAIDQGHLANTDLTMAEIYPDYIMGAEDPRTAEISLDQLLTMTAGFQWVDRSQDYWDWRYNRNRLKAGLMLPLAYEPGSSFIYATPVSHLIGGAISRATGASLLDYANSHLFGPMGEEVATWSQDPAGYFTGGTGLHLTPRQMAKFGYLLLRGGEWDGHQIVSTDWVQNATRNHLPTPGSIGYGYQFWVRSMAGCEGYMAWGRGGQFIAVVPERDLVIVVTSQPRIDGPGTSYYHPLFDIITEASEGAACSPNNELEQVALVEAPSAPLDIPTELAGFFAAYITVMTGSDPGALSAMYSDQYYSDGADKATRLQELLPIQPRITEMRIIPESYEVSPKGISYRAVVQFGRGITSTKNFITIEDGRWVLLGNPNGKPEDVAIPTDVEDFLKAFLASIESGDAEKYGESLADTYLTNGLTKADLISFMEPFLLLLKPSKIIISKFDRQGDRAIVDGVILSRSFGNLPLKPLYGSMVMIDGRWLWEGNQAEE